MPLLRNWCTAAFLNTWVRNIVAGIPRFSNSTVSCTLHNVQDPHPPRAAAATCTSFAISLSSVSVAGREKYSLRRMITFATP
jgi:hypothetical protein